MNRHAAGDLSPRAHSVIMFFAGVQLTLAATAWTDLALRPAAEVRGSKRMWALVIAVSFIGPLAYLTFGRQPLDPAGAHEAVAIE